MRGRSALARVKANRLKERLYNDKSKTGWISDLNFGPFVLIEHWITKVDAKDDKYFFGIPNPVGRISGEFFKWWATENGGHDPINHADADLYQQIIDNDLFKMDVWKKWRFLQADFLILDLSLRTIWPIPDSEKHTDDHREIGALLLFCSIFLVALIVLLSLVLPIKFLGKSGVTAEIGMFSAIANYINSANFKRLIIANQAEVLSAISVAKTAIITKSQNLESLINTLQQNIGTSVPDITTKVNTLQTNVGTSSPDLSTQITSVLADIALLANDLDVDKNEIVGKLDQLISNDTTFLNTLNDILSRIRLKLISI